MPSGGQFLNYILVKIRFIWEKNEQGGKNGLESGSEDEMEIQECSVLDLVPWKCTWCHVRVSLSTRV